MKLKTCYKGSIVKIVLYNTPCNFGLGFLKYISVAECFSNFPIKHNSQ